MRYLIELMEQAGFGVLLEATARAAFLLKTYGPKLEAKFQATPEPADIIAAIDAAPGDTPAEQIIAYLLGFDPTPNQQNGQWLVVRYLKDALKLEDLERAHDVLAKFEAMKAARTLPPGSADINTIKTLADLFQIVKGSETAIVSADQAEQQAMLAQAKVVYDGKDCKILIPNTQEAACFFGRDTEWCTAWGDPKGRHPGRTNRYADYARSGALYIITLKAARDGKDVMLQYHAETAQFMDVDDRQVSTEYVRNLLTSYPIILKTIGEAKFAASHLTELGINFFSPRALAQVPATLLIRSVHNKADFDALPDAVKTTDFIAEYLLAKNPDAVKKIIPATYLTSEVAAALAVKHTRGRFNWSIFEIFPNLSDWPVEAVENAARAGRLTYDQYMQMPAEQRTPEKLKAVIQASAASNPTLLTTYPAGLIASLDLTGAILADNYRAIEYLHDKDLPDAAIVAYLQDQTRMNAARKLPYIPPHRLTPALVEQINAGTHLQLDAATVTQQISAIVAGDTAQARDIAAAIKRPEIPARYTDDPLFWEAVMRARDTAVGQLPPDRARYAVKDADGWLTAFFTAFPAERVTTGMLEILVQRYNGEHDRLYYWRTRLLGWRPLWSDTMIVTALKRGFLKAGDIQDDETTPAVAAILFGLDPTKQALAYKADDESLIRAIASSGYQAHLIDHIPADRITEPVAFAAISKEAVKTAKQRFPKTALSQRVYFAGLPYSFALKDVPKKWRDDAMTLRAVIRDPDQLKYLADPLAWLNAHPAIKAEVPGHWQLGLEQRGLTLVQNGFAAIAALPAETLVDGFVLYQAQPDKKTQRWFLRKGDRPIATLEIKNSKLSLENNHPDKNLEPVLRDIAKRFLTPVRDISILNKVGIYRDRTGQISDPDTFRASLPKKLVDGIEWSHTAHLKGKLYTAWKDSTAILTLYLAASGGWGGSYDKIQKIEILDQSLGMANNAAILKGVQDIRRHPEHGLHGLRDIGISWNKNWGLWLMTQRDMGKVGPFTVYYSPSHRVISIFGSKGLAAFGALLMTGKVAKEQVYDWLYEKDAHLLRKTLDAIAAKIGPQVKTK